MSADAWLALFVILYALSVVARGFEYRRERKVYEELDRQLQERRAGAGGDGGGVNGGATMKLLLLWVRLAHWLYGLPDDLMYWHMQRRGYGIFLGDNGVLENVTVKGLTVTVVGQDARIVDCVFVGGNPALFIVNP